VVVLLVILTFTVFIVVGALIEFKVPQKLKAWLTGKKMVSSGAGSPEVAPEYEPYRIPGGLFFHSGHTWAHLEFSGPAKIGMDNFANRTLGRIDGIEVHQAEGAPVKQGEKLFSVTQGAKKIDFVSPLDGVLQSVNERIKTAPGDVKKDPYAQGWILAVQPTNFNQNVKRLKFGNEAFDWMKSQVDKLTEFLSMYARPPQPEGITVQDGGMHVEGIVEKLEEPVIKEFQKKFLT